MRRTIKYIISFIFMFIVTCSGLLCSAAIITDSLDNDQKGIILSNAVESGLNGMIGPSSYWGIASYTDTLSTASYFVRGYNWDNNSAFDSSSVTLNLPFYLSFFDSLTIQLVLATNLSTTSSNLSTPTFYKVFGSTSSTVAGIRLGDVYIANVIPPGSTRTTKTTFFGSLYQITINDPIDFLRIKFTVSSYSSNQMFIFGFAGIDVTGTSEALQNIDQQVSQIGIKVDTLTSAIQNAASNIGSIVTGQGTILSAVEDIKDYVESIDDKQDIIIYATQNDQLIIQEYNERLTEIKNEFNEYNSILEQYYNPPNINNVTNIIDGGVPSEYDPTVVAPVLSAIFDNSIVTIILVAVLALAVMSYVLFGKKG